MKACGLTSFLTEGHLTDGLRTISTDIKERIVVMTNHFINERMVDPYIVAIDSTLLKAKGHLWHKSSMIKGIYLVQVLILMPDGDSAIPRVGYLVTNYI